MGIDNEYILDSILGIIRDIQNLGQQALDYAQKSMPYVIDTVDFLTENAVIPFASLLLSMFAVMQMYKVISYLNDIGAPPGGSARYEQLGFTLGKIGFMFWLITSMKSIMWGLMSAGNWLMGKIQAIGSYHGNQDFTELEVSIRTILDQENAFTRFVEGMAIRDSLTVINLLVTVCGLIVFVLFYARMLQILVMVCIAPIPLVTLIHDEHKQIGISFLKSFMAVVLQGAVMVLMIYIYSGVITFSMGQSNTLTGMVWNAAGYAVLLVVALATSGALSKKVMAAM